MKKIGSLFIATIVAILVSSTILSGGIHISEAKKSSLEELRAQQQERQQQQQKQQQNLQTQAVTTQSATSGASNLADNSVTSPKIKDGEVKTPDLASEAVTRAKISPGAVGAEITIRSIRSDPIQPGHSASATAVCEPGELATGGGFGSLPTFGQVRVTESAPSTNNGWLVVAFNSDTVPNDVFVTVKCLKLVP